MCISYVGTILFSDDFVPALGILMFCRSVCGRRTGVYSDEVNAIQPPRAAGDVEIDYYILLLQSSVNSAVYCLSEPSSTARDSRKCFTTFSDRVNAAACGAYSYINRGGVY